MTLPPEPELACGMEAYATDSPPCSGRIKCSDEDFRVEEVLRAEGLVGERRPGYVPLYRVEKRGVDTFHLEMELSTVLKSRLTHAGIKDRHANAVQYITPSSTRSEAPPAVEGENYRVTLQGFLPRPLDRSMVSGNRFRVLVREGCPQLADRLEELERLAAEGGAPNFFGMQRFGGAFPLTHRVGRELVKGRAGGAVSLLLSEPRRTDGPAARAARSLAREGRFDEAAAALPRSQDYERMVAKRLARRPDDPVGAIRAVPIALRRFYVHAYQSFLFNRALSEALRRGLEISSYEKGDNWGEVSNDGLTLKKVYGVRDEVRGRPEPLMQIPGYAYRNYGSRFDSCMEKVMADEGVAPRDFYVKEMQEVSDEGGFRRVHMTVRDYSWEAHEGGVEVAFTLARGEYATVLLREALKPREPAESGFG